MDQQFKAWTIIQPVNPRGISWKKDQLFKESLLKTREIQHWQWSVLCTVSVLGREEGYTVKYTPPPEEVPEAKPEGTPEGGGEYLTVYPKLCPNKDFLSF